MAIFFQAESRFRFHGTGLPARRMRVAVLATAFLTTVVAAGAAPISFEQALLLAEQRSAALSARQATADGAQQARTAAGRLPDPKLAVGLENFPVSGPERFSWNRDSMTMRRVGLMQDVPNAARRAAQREAADATITGLSRMALVAGAAVLPCYPRREAAGYTLVIEPALDNFPTNDPTADAARMNAVIEAQVRRQPHQYFWLHKRFKSRPPGEADFYG